MTKIISVVQKVYDPTDTKERDGMRTHVKYKVFKIKSKYSQIDTSESSDIVQLYMVDSTVPTLNSQTPNSHTYPNCHTFFALNNM